MQNAACLEWYKEEKRNGGTRKRRHAAKNIRQIGQISGNQKIYLEDYVITYLRQILTPDENMRVMILYGHKEMIEDELYWFVNGAVEAQHDFFMEKRSLMKNRGKKSMKWRENFSRADSYGLGDHKRGFHGRSGRTDHADTAAVFQTGSEAVL